MAKTQTVICTLITGASAGIGEQTAYALAAKGHNLILIARRKQLLNAVKEKCVELGSPFVLSVVGDIANEKNIKTIIKKIRSLIKINNKLKVKLEVNILINNAGLAKGVELVQNSDTNDWSAMLDTNVKGLLWVSRELFSDIIKNKGHIINIGSVAGRLVYEGGAVYCATKFAVRALSEGFRMDLKGTGVRVTNIEPGMVKSEFSLVRLGQKKKADLVYAGMTPLSPYDVAQNILWCLQQPSHVNIQELVIYPTDQASVGQVVRKNS